MGSADRHEDRLHADTERAVEMSRCRAAGHGTSDTSLKLMQQLAHVGCWDYDLAEGRLTWSEEVYRIFGVAPEAVPSLDLFLDCVHPDDAGSLKAQILSGLPDRSDYRIVLKDGTQKHIHEEVRVDYDAAGRAVRICGTAQDVTEQKRAEQALRESETLVRDIIDNVDEAILLIDRNYRIMTANRAYCLFANLALEDVVGRPCYEVSHAFARPCHEEGRACSVRDMFVSGNPCVVHYKAEDDRGNWIYVEKKAFPVRDASGAIVAAIEAARDVTDHHLLEAERLKTQKLEAVGMLAGGIAHDFNNLLQGVFGYLSLAMKNLDQKDRALALLQQAEKALQMSVNLTSQLLTFSKGGMPARKRIPLPPVLEYAARFALSGSRSDYRLAVAPGLWHVDADEGQMAQVVQNLVLNAREAMPDGSTVTISAENVEVPEGTHASLPGSGRFVRITIEDTGIGIPEKNLPKIFDPYFSTKQKGSGLGLATTYSIIRNHGGAIDVTSEPGRGTAFRIHLPAGDPVEEEAPGAPGGHGRCGRVLLMDDEEMVLHVASEMLHVLGHEAATAKDGQEAIDTYLAARREGRPFDVVILDLTVKGGMGGEEAMKKLREHDPGVCAVVSSGYSDDQVVADFRAHGFAAFLNKPYRLESLMECLGALMK